MENRLKIRCENTSTELFVEFGTSLEEILETISTQNENGYIAAYVNNQFEGLNYKIFENKTINFIDSSHFEGKRVYQRTLSFIFSMAMERLYPHVVPIAQDPVPKGIYFEINGLKIDENVVRLIQNEMDSIIKADFKIEFDKLYYKEAIELFSSKNLNDKISLLKSNPHLYISLNNCNGYVGKQYGVLAPSTGYVSDYGLVASHNGLSLLVTKRIDFSKVTNNNMFDVLEAQKELLEMIQIPNIAALNSVIIEGKSDELIKIGETIQERQFCALADRIVKRIANGSKLILIAGPSSSGKTTFSNRLNIQLRAQGIKPLIISMDNFFVSRVQTPLDEKGNPNFEAVEAMDLDLLNQQLEELIKGESVDVPIYNFVTGCRDAECTKMKLEANGVIIMEGIHALNPLFSQSVPTSEKVRVFASPHTTISIDNNTLFESADCRLIRRMIRDNNYRNSSALRTLKGWGSVRRGEAKYIEPYISHADEMFNSSLFFEISILKTHVEPLLHSISNIEPEYGEAQRLLHILELFVPIADKSLPPTSILREFIGGSSFVY